MIRKAIVITIISTIILGAATFLDNDSTPLPVINISIDDETIDSLGLDDTYFITEYTGATMTLYNTDNSVIKSDIKIHARGGTTINLPQKSYRISLIKDKNDLNSDNVKLNLLGLRKDDDWILSSMYSDYEKIRNVFSMNLWHEMSTLSNEYRYVEVYINNNYHGLYALTYPIDNKTFKLKKDETLVKKKDWSKSEFSQDIEYNKALGFDWLPGYYLEEGPSDGYHTIHDLFYTIAYSDNPNKIRDTVDMTNAIDLYLFYELTQAADNIYGDNIKNLLVANKKAHSTYGYKLYFAPWDMDQTWGNRFVDGMGQNGITGYHMASNYELPIMWSPAYFLMASDDPTIVQEIQTRYSELRSTVWSDEHIKELLDSYEEDIYESGAYERTMARWPDGNYYDPNIKLSVFKYFVTERFKYMDDYIENLPRSNSFIP